MSTDFRGNNKLVKYLGEITGKQFEQAYNDMSLNTDKLPVASTLIPVMVCSSGDAGTCQTQKRNDEGNYLFNAWIYYEQAPKKDNTFKTEL